MIILSCFDMTYLSFSVLEETPLFEYEGLYSYLFYPVKQFTLFASIFMVVAIALERYFAVHRPLKYHNHSHRRLMKYASSVILLALIFSVLKFFEEPGRGWQFGDIGEISFVKGWGSSYVIYDTLFREIIAMGLAPFLILIFLYTKIYHKLKASMKSVANQDRNRTNASKAERQNKLASIFAGFVATLLICHTPRLVNAMYLLSNAKQVFNCYTRYHEYIPLWWGYMHQISKVLITINSAVNVLLYAFLSRQFREECKKVFHKITKGHFRWAAVPSTDQVGAPKSQDRTRSTKTTHF